jgi:hypothetical protein
MVRNQSTVGKADSIGEAIDKWETTELEKVEAKAKLLGCVLPAAHSFARQRNRFLCISAAYNTLHSTNNTNTR